VLTVCLAGGGGIVPTLVHLYSSSLYLGYWGLGGGIVPTLVHLYSSLYLGYWGLGGGIVPTLVCLYSSFIYLEPWGLERTFNYLLLENKVISHIYALQALTAILADILHNRK
jgi:hypothetical protein